eukprot:s228_g66.t1
MAGLGIPVKLLHEGIGHTVTCELKTGEMYRGHLMNCEDNMNAMLEGVTVTGRDGKVTNLEQVYLRGSQIRYFILPESYLQENYCGHASSRAHVQEEGPWCWSRRLWPWWQGTWQGPGCSRTNRRRGHTEVNGAQRGPILQPTSPAGCCAALLNVLGANEVLTNKTSNR